MLYDIAIQARLQDRLWSGVLGVFHIFRILSVGLYRLSLLFRAIDFVYFRAFTSKTHDHEKRNAVITERKTWESIPLSTRPPPCQDG